MFVYKVSLSYVLSQCPDHVNEELPTSTAHSAAVADKVQKFSLEVNVESGVPLKHECNVPMESTRGTREKRAGKCVRGEWSERR